MGLKRLGIRALLPVAALGLTALIVAPVRAQGTAYAIGNGGTSLVRLNVNSPGGASVVATFNGAATALDAIDFRPLDGGLYGYLNATNTLYLVNTSTGALTAVASGAGVAETTTNLLGIDFNPRLDRVRVVTDSAQNLVYNPNTNAAPTVATDLFYGVGDPNAGGLGVNVIDNAYSNNFITPSLTTTTQYVIDYNLDILATLANNTGQLTTVGALGVDTDIYTGFDIFTTSSGANSGFALLDGAAGSAPTLYSINLTTGAATSLGALGGGLTQTYSLAVVAAAAPEPGTIGLFLLGGLSFAGVACRRIRRMS